MTTRVCGSRSTKTLGIQIKNRLQGNSQGRRNSYPHQRLLPHSRGNINGKKEVGVSKPVRYISLLLVANSDMASRIDGILKEADFDTSKFKRENPDLDLCDYSKRSCKRYVIGFGSVHRFHRKVPSGGDNDHQVTPFFSTMAATRGAFASVSTCRKLDQLHRGRSLRIIPNWQGRGMNEERLWRSVGRPKT